MDMDENVARRLGVVKLAEKLGNVAEACLQFGVDQTSFYKWRKRFKEHGLDGLKDRPPVHKSHPQATPDGTVRRVLDLAMQHPSYGCDSIRAMLPQQGGRLSAITVQKLLNEHGLGNRHDRWLALETRFAEKSVELTDEQVAVLEERNPCFRERHSESNAPGERLYAETFPVRRRAGKYICAVVDTFCSYAFGFVASSRYFLGTLPVIHDHVLPWYKDRGLPACAVLTGSGQNHEVWRLCRGDLEQNGIELHCLSRTNGFMERFKTTVKDEFLRVEPRYGSIEALRAAFKGWLIDYNTKRPHRGYRNHGRTPAQSIGQSDRWRVGGATCRQGNTGCMSPSEAMAAADERPRGKRLQRSDAGCRGDSRGVVRMELFCV